MSPEENRLRIDDYLSHMLEATQLARTYLDGMSGAEFTKDSSADLAL